MNQPGGGKRRSNPGETRDRRALLKMFRGRAMLGRGSVPAGICAFAEPTGNGKAPVSDGFRFCALDLRSSVPWPPCLAAVEIMARFTIKRLRPALQEKYRWSPIGSTSTPLKINDFLDDGEVCGDSVYHAWSVLKDEGRSLQVGDLLIAEDDKVYQCTYSGFEEASWMPIADTASAKPNENEPDAAILASREVEAAS